MSEDQTLTSASIDTESRIDFPDKGFVNNYGISRHRRPSVTLIVQRDVVGPVLIRNTEDARAETQEFNGQIHAQSNPEKFVSKERLTGLDLLRDLDSSGDLIDDGYSYNQPETWEQALNLDPFSYGISGTGTDEFAIKSHVIQGYTYTTGEYNFTEEETRNAAYETGTMKSHDTEDGFDQSSALYSHAPIKPGNSFVHFVTIEAALPGMLTYVLHNILNTSSYGARDTRHGKNIDNKIIGLIQSNHPVTLSTAEWLMDYHTESESDSITTSISEYVADAERDHWDVYFNDVESYPSYPEWFTDLCEIAGRKADDATEQLNNILTATTLQARSDIGE